MQAAMRAASGRGSSVEGVSEELLRWRALRVVSRNFGDLGREVRICGEAFPQLRRLWPYLRNFPGLRSFAPYPEAIGHWFPETVMLADSLPEDLAKALAQPGVGRQTTWVLDCPALRLPLSSDLATASPTPPALDIVAVNFHLSYSSLHGVHSLYLPKGEILLSRAGCLATMAAQSLRDTIKEKITTALKENLKMDEREFNNPWSFSDAPIDSLKCQNLLTRIIYLIQQGEKFTAQELTNLFFGVTKLFQAQCTRLRRMVYLVIKELEPSDQEVFICMSCLIKDMNSKNDCFRANSIRVLSRVLDPAMAAQIDRYLKTAIVDKNPFVASSALVCGMTLHATVPDVVKRWVNEIQELLALI
eukprot:s1154_g6.t1